MRGFCFKLSVLFLFVCPFFDMHSMQAVDLGAKLKEEFAPSTPKVRIVVGEDSVIAQKILGNLKTELLSLRTKWKDFIVLSLQKSNEIKTLIEKLKNQTTEEKSDISSQKLEWLVRFDKVIIEIKDIKQNIINTLKIHIDFWDKYFSRNNNFTERIDDKSLYSFEDLQKITKKIAFQEDQDLRLKSKKEEESLAIAREEQNLAAKDKELKQVEKAIEDLKKQSEINKEEISLFDLEKEVFLKEKDYIELKIELHQKTYEFIESEILVIQDQLKNFRDDMAIVRQKLHIDNTDVNFYEQKNNEIKNESLLKRSELLKVRSEFESIKLKSDDDLARLSKRLKIVLTNIRQIEDWDIKDHNISENHAFFLVFYAYIVSMVSDKQIQKINAQLLLEEAKQQKAQSLSEVVKLLYSISSDHIKDAHYSIEKEKALYKDKKISIQSRIKGYKEQLSLMAQSMNEGQKISYFVKKQQEYFTEINTHVSLNLQKKYQESLSILLNISQKIEEQQGVSKQYAEALGQLIEQDEELLEVVNFMIHEFETIGVWQRSTSAVTWIGLKNMLPNVFQFVKEIYFILHSYVASLSITKIITLLAQYSIFEIFVLFLSIILAFFIFVFLQAMLPPLYKSLLNSINQNENFYTYKLLLVIIVGFFNELFKLLFFWIGFLFFALWYNFSSAVMIVFYTYTIIFLIYASHLFLAQFIKINRMFDYVLMSKRLLNRFSFIFSFFSISTIIILVFRKMFMLVMVYQESEFPNILLRVYHVVIFISIVFSIDKEEILRWIPQKSWLGQKMAMLTDKYYYLLLIVILSLLVLSDPYLGGYGILIWHIFWNICITLLVLGVLTLIYKVIRQYSLVLFFQEDESIAGTKERFDYAKTWYALYVLFLVIVFFGIGCVLCANLWGYDVGYLTFKRLFFKELFKLESLDNAGKIVSESFRISDMLYILMVSFLGVFFAYFFKNFVLQRVFDVQYVDPGVQNTVNIISRYVIIISAVMIACVQSKLGFFVNYIFLFGLATFGWSFKDLFTDFVAYFFILVQRPLKLGDYVKIDSETMGVVRKISPRAVILRRKNAFTIVVPNSMNLKSSLHNWNYTRSYIGLPDIEFSVPFGTNIELVRMICMKVLDEEEEVLKVPQPFVRLDNFCDKGYFFMMRGYVNSGNTLRQWDIASNLRFALVAQLLKENITIAEPIVRLKMSKSTMHEILEEE